MTEQERTMPIVMRKDAEPIDDPAIVVTPVELESVLDKALHGAQAVIQDCKDKA